MKKYIVMMGFMGLVASCNQSEDASWDENVIRVEAQMANSRATRTSFEAGDCMGLLPWNIMEMKLLHSNWVVTISTMKRWSIAVKNGLPKPVARCIGAMWLVIFMVSILTKTSQV